MKISKKLFNELCDTIDENVISKHNLQAIICHRKNIKFVDDQFTAFCWSIFHKSKFDVMKLYNSGLCDTHIETALKRILSDFE